MKIKSRTAERAQSMKGNSSWSGFFLIIRRLTELACREVSLVFCHFLAPLLSHDKAASPPFLWCFTHVLNVWRRTENNAAIFPIFLPGTDKYAETALSLNSERVSLLILLVLVAVVNSNIDNNPACCKKYFGHIMASD